MCQHVATSTLSECDAARAPAQQHVPDIVPRDPLSQAAYAHVKQHLQPAILAHSLRVFYYAKDLSARKSTTSFIQEQSSWHIGERLSLLFTACMFHDFGACSLRDDGKYRFEVAGADAAVDFLRCSGNTSEVDLHAIWTAIACHTSPHIGDRIGALAKIMRQAPLIDFHRLSDVEVLKDVVRTDKLYVLEKDVQDIEAIFPREDIEKVLSDSIVAQAQREGGRGRAPGGSWPGDLYRAAEEDPEWTGVNKAF